MMNCNQATRLMSDSRERSLTIRERAALKMHTLLCDGCRNFYVQVDDIGRLARGYTKEEVLHDHDDDSQESGNTK
jgi:predicted anti-sigma-YlaC factor YlaD